MWTMIYHIERGRTRKEFIVPFEAKPRRYLEFETWSNPSKCGCHCTRSLRWAYFWPPIHMIQHTIFHNFNSMDNHFPHCYRFGKHVKNVGRVPIVSPAAIFIREFFVVVAEDAMHIFQRRRFQTLLTWFVTSRWMSSVDVWLKNVGQIWKPLDPQLKCERQKLESKRPRNRMLLF